MCKKIIYLCFCILCFLNAGAQAQSAAKSLLNNIVKLTDTLVDDAGIKDPCKRNIKTFSSNLPGPNKIPADPKSINRLIQVSNTFVNSFKEANAKQCSNDKIISLVNSTSQFVKVLQDLNKSTADTTLVKATFTDHSRNGIADWQLNMDSLDHSIGNALSGIAVRDSVGHVQVTLLHNSRNAFKLNAIDSNITITPGQNKLIISLSPGKRIDGTTLLSSEALQQQLDTLQTANKRLIISVSVLAFLIIAGAWLYMRTNRSYKMLLATLSDNPQESTADSLTAQIKAEPHPPAPVAMQVKEELTPAIEVNEMPANEPGSNGLVICEVMMTAGPRKKPMSDLHSDIDLGEDVCGFISDAGGAFVWLLDGTSDDYPLKNPLNNREYFSARLLAQSIGDGLRNKFTSNQQGSFANMVQQTIEEIKLNWLRNIEMLPDEEKTILRRNINSKNFPHCSTTALIARLQMNGSLEAYRVGDSKMLLFRLSPDDTWEVIDTSLAEKNENGGDRIFFRLELTDEDHFDIVSNGNLECDIEEVSNIHTMICFSDGIGLETEQTLKQDYKANPVKAKREIMYEVQGTGDDKSICFIELKKTG